MYKVKVHIQNLCQWCHNPSIYLHSVVNKNLKIKNLKSESIFYIACTASGKQMRKTHIKNNSSNGILLSLLYKNNAHCL